MKPIRATDANLEKLVYPVAVLPKIDGVRGVNTSARLLARSGKPFKNRYNTQRLSIVEYEGFDGELVAGNVCEEGLCSKTTSALTTINGEVPVNWCLFDYCVEGITDELGYVERHKVLCEVVSALHESNPELTGCLWVVPYTVINNQTELLAAYETYLSDGFEGLIIRSLDGPYKHGTSTIREGYYLRMKPLDDTEIKITSILEGQTNGNPQNMDPHGYAERSTHAVNMLPNGQVGTLIGELLSDVIYKGEVFLEAGTVVHASPGKMTREERQYYFQNPDKLLGRISKIKYFPINMKDRLRMARHHCFRDTVDIV